MPQFEQAPDGHRVVLRPPLARRFLYGPLLAAFSAAWIGAVVLPAPRARLARFADLLPPVDPVVFAIAGAVWLVVAAVATLAAARCLFGADVVTLRPTDVVARRLPFGRERIVDGAQASSAFVRPSDVALAVYDGRRALVLASAGSRADLQWLRDELRRRYPATAATPLPPKYAVMPASDGAVVVTISASHRRRFVAGFLAGAVVLAGLGVRDGFSAGTLCGIAVCAALAALVALREETWRMRENELVHRRTVGPWWSRTSAFTDRRHELASSTDYLEMHALGEFTARQTGWPLRDEA